jgi:hypothetical protein
VESVQGNAVDGVLYKIWLIIWFKINVIVFKHHFLNKGQKLLSNFLNFGEKTDVSEITPSYGTFFVKIIIDYN